MTREPEDTLLKLIDAAERMVTARPLAGIDLAATGELVDAIRNPVGVVLSGAHAILMDAMLAAAHRSAVHGGRDLYERWLMIVGALLPMVRADLSACIEIRRRPLERDPSDVGLSRGGHR